MCGVSIGGTSCNNNIYKTIVYEVKAKDGSDIVVFDSLEKGFIFYADTDNDGWADVKGFGYYKKGISRTMGKINLPPNTIKISDLIEKNKNAVKKY